MTYLDYDFGFEYYGITITHVKNKSFWILFNNGNLMQVVGSNNINESALYFAKNLMKGVVLK
jgi:hypothetical protein